jgi:hypothetical protein
LNPNAVFPEDPFFPGIEGYRDPLRIGRHTVPGTGKHSGERVLVITSYGAIGLSEKHFSTYGRNGPSGNKKLRERIDSNLNEVFEKDVAREAKHEERGIPYRATREGGRLVRHNVTGLRGLEITLRMEGDLWTRNSDLVRYAGNRTAQHATNWGPARAKEFTSIVLNLVDSSDNWKRIWLERRRDSDGSFTWYVDLETTESWDEPR